MVITLKYDPNLAPGTWKGVDLGGEFIVHIKCPKCGGIATLSHHTIEASGFVSPSVICPAKDCFWHKWVMLDGWSDKLKEASHGQAGDGR